MKILIFTNLYDPYHRGGAERVAKTQAEGLASRGHEVMIVTSRSFSWRAFFSSEKEKSEGVTVYRFFPWNIFWYDSLCRHRFFARLVWHFFDMWNVQSALKTDALLGKEKPDAIITHNLTGLGFFIPFVIRLRRSHHIHILHDVQLLNPSGLLIKGEEYSWMNKGIAAEIYRGTVKRLFASPSVVVSPSEWLLSEHCYRGFFSASQTRVLKNPAPTVFAIPAIRHEGLTLLFIGQMEKHKGITWLIEAFRKCIRRDIFLRVIGTGNVEAEAKKLSEGDSRVVFLGKLSGEEITKEFSQSDAVVLPSLCYENSPTVVYESFAAGIPVIASNLGGIPELVKDGETGWLFSAGDTNEFLRVLEDVAQKPQEAKERGARARAFIGQYDTKRHIDDLEDFLKEDGKNIP